MPGTFLTGQRYKPAAALRITLHVLFGLIRV